MPKTNRTIEDQARAPNGSYCSAAEGIRPTSGPDFFMLGHFYGGVHMLRGGGRGIGQNS